VRGEGGRGKRGTNRQAIGWGRGGLRWLADGGIEPVAGVGGCGGAPVRKREQGPTMQLQGEVEKVVGGLVWAMWVGRGASTRE
jgi:hypothetical protein